MSSGNNGGLHLREGLKWNNILDVTATYKSTLQSYVVSHGKLIKLFTLEISKIYAECFKICFFSVFHQAQEASLAAHSAGKDI